LYFNLHLNNITGAEVITFLRQLLRHLRGPLVLLWDGGKIHRRRDARARCVVRVDYKFFTLDILSAFTKRPEKGCIWHLTRKRRVVWDRRHDMNVVMTGVDHQTRNIAPYHRPTCPSEAAALLVFRNPA
jgi:hypothetical protein